jgi:group I intron endonuclease
MGSGINIKAAIKKYGRHNFTKEILEDNLTKEIINAREIHWIKKLNTHSEYGYNLTDGGDGIFNVSAEAKKRIGESAKKRVGILSPRYKKPITEEHKEALRKHNTGKIVSEETRKKISKSLLNKIVSPETRKKMSENRLGKKHPDHVRINMKNNQPNKISVYKLDKKTKQIVSKYNSIGDAAKDNKISSSGISSCINGKAKSAGGFIWQKIK